MCFLAGQQDAQLNTSFIITRMEGNNEYLKEIREKEIFFPDQNTEHWNR